MVVLLAVSLAVGWHIDTCANGFLLNNYPFLSPDSYDWILEGEYLFRLLSGVPPERPLTRVRNPVFVVLMAADAALGQRGLVFAALTVAVTFATGWLLIRHLGRFRYQAAVQCAFLVIILLAQLNFTKVYVLADGLCVMLSIAAFLATLRAARPASSAWWVAAGAGVTALAGLTAPYGVLAATVAGAVAGTAALRRGERAIAGRMVALIGVAAVLTRLGYRVWFSSIPHSSEPNPLDILQISTMQLRFYAEAWTYTFLPLAPLVLVIWYRRGRRRDWPDTMTMAAWLVTLSLMVLCLCYRWRSIRFTSFFWPFLILGLFRSVSARGGEPPRPGSDRAAVVAAAAVLFQSLFLSPPLLTLPSFNSLALDPSRSWVVQFVRARPLDRMDLAARCGSPATLCAAARPLAGGSPYQQWMAAHYESLMLGRPLP